MPIRKEHDHVFFKIPKCYYGLVECSSDNPVEKKNFLQVRNFSLKIRNKLIIFFQKNFSPESLLGHVECRFESPAEIFFREVRKFLKQPRVQGRLLIKELNRNLTQLFLVNLYTTVTTSKAIAANFPDSSQRKTSVRQETG